MSDTKELERLLAEPFEPTEVKWKPGTVKGDRALAMCYIDARLVMDRLDAVVGSTGWQDEYEVLPTGSVVCKLSLHIGEEWITKTDVGSPSEQPDEGDRTKAAFSDALKRAAVKYGVGRYLYALGSVWCDFDPQKKRLLKVPTLPDWAIPKPKAKPSQPAKQESPPKQPAPANGHTAPKLDPEIESLWKQYQPLALPEHPTLEQRKALWEKLLEPTGAKTSAELTAPRQASLKGILQAAIAKAEKKHATSPADINDVPTGEQTPPGPAKQPTGRKVTKKQSAVLRELARAIGYDEPALGDLLQERYGAEGRGLLVVQDLLEKEADDLQRHLLAERDEMARMDAAEREAIATER